MSNPDTKLLASGIQAGGSHPRQVAMPQFSQLKLRSPALVALLAHLPGVFCAAILIASGIQLTLSGMILIVSLSAALLAWHWRLPLWWRYINLFFLPLIGVVFYLQSQAFAIDPNWYLAAFLSLALTSIGAVRTRVPLYLSSPRAAQELAQRLPPNGRLIDLGCGLGGPLARIHQERPDARLAGIESAPLNWLISKIRLKISGAEADIRLGNLWTVNLGDYDIVYAYLSPAPMARLWDKALLEMKTGSLFISNSFSVDGVDTNFDPDEIIEISQPGDLAHAQLLIWRMR
jgi:hypothetical protein